MQQLPVKYRMMDSKARRPEQGVSGLSLYALSETLKNGKQGSTVVYDTGVEFQIPKGFLGLIYLDRSAATSTLTMQQSPYIVTPEDRGSIKLTLKNFSQFGSKLGIGSKIAELIVIPQIQIQLEEVVSEEQVEKRDRTLQRDNQEIEVGSETVTETSPES